MNATARRAARSERGAVLIHVAIAIFALFGMMVYVFDFGIVWVARGQAQNAADAGALAAALARGFDDFDDPPAANGKADTAGRLAALANLVWTAAPGVNMSWTCPTGVTGRCARADVYRNGEFSSATLLVIFGPVLGITSHGVRATATAVVATGNTTNCMRPFSVADRWVEVAGTAQTDGYDRWDSAGNNVVELDPKDIYNAGTGWQVPQDVGAEQILKGGNNPNSSSTTIQSGWFMPVRLPNGEDDYLSGGDDYRAAIHTCIGTPVSEGDYLPLENGAMVGPTGMGVDDLIALDPDATFNTGTKQVDDTCAPGCNPISPRIVPISVFDIDDFQYHQAANDWEHCPTGGKCIKVVKILGYFVEGMSGQDVVGYLMTMPGEFDSGAPTSPGGAFLVNIRLVR
jgi:hypothetical protein